MDQLIKELGGATAVAKAVGVKPNAVSNWRRRGIPWKLRPAIARIASEKAVSPPANFWEAGA